MSDRLPSPTLLVSDIDNTLFDWVKYYVHAFSALLRQVEKSIGVPYAQLAEEAKQVFIDHGSIEYPFVVQELPSVIAFCAEDIDHMLAKIVAPARDAFNAEAARHLKPYDDVPATLATLRERHQGVPVVALTDAPRYVAMWKLNKLGLLPHFDAVYGLADPRLPTSEGRVKVDPEILLKHLKKDNWGYSGKIRILPDDYEKPGTKGLKTVLMDYELDEPPAERHRVVWIGDNERKDVGLGKRLGVRTIWASYGRPAPDLLTRLIEFSPPQNVHKNASLPSNSPDNPKPDVVLQSFAEILKYL